MKKFFVLSLAVALVLGAPSALAAPATEKIIDDDCVINETVFEKKWKEHSEFDSTEPQNFNVLEYNEIATKISDLSKEYWQLEKELYHNRRMREEIGETKNQIVLNLRNNLVKSLFRLSIVTADVISSSKDFGSSLAAETMIKKLLGLGLWGFEEGVEMFIPSADDLKLSDKDLKLLSDMHLNKEELDRLLAELEGRVALVSARMDEISGEVRGLQEEQDAWELNEKKRVREMLIADCQENKKKQAAAADRWELSTIRVQCHEDYYSQKYTLDSGSGSYGYDDGPNVLERDRDIFKMSYSWNEPEWRYDAGQEIRLTITSRIDTWTYRGSPNLVGGWIRVSNDHGDTLRDDNGESDIAVGGSMGNIAKGSDTKTVSMKLWKGRIGEKFEINVTTPSGHVFYTFEWRD